MLEQEPLFLEDYREIPPLDPKEFLRADEISVQFQNDSPLLVDASLGPLVFFA